MYAYTYIQVLFRVPVELLCTAFEILYIGNGSLEAVFHHWVYVCMYIYTSAISCTGWIALYCVWDTVYRKRFSRGCVSPLSVCMHVHIYQCYFVYRLNCSVLRLRYCIYSSLEAVFHHWVHFILLYDTYILVNNVNSIRTKLSTITLSRNCIDLTIATTPLKNFCCHQTSFYVLSSSYDGTNATYYCDHWILIWSRLQNWHSFCLLWVIRVLRSCTLMSAIAGSSSVRRRWLPRCTTTAAGGVTLALQLCVRMEAAAATSKSCMPYSGC